MVVGTALVTVCATVHTVSVVMVVINGSTIETEAKLLSESILPFGRLGLDVPVIMLWRTLVAVKVSVVKWVVRETLASPEGAAASALSAGCRYEVSEMRPP